MHAVRLAIRTLVCIAGQQAVASLQWALVPLERCTTPGRCPCVRMGGSAPYTHKYPPTVLVGSILVQLNTSRGAFRGGGGIRPSLLNSCSPLENLSSRMPLMIANLDHLEDFASS